MMQTDTSGWDGLDFDPDGLKKQVEKAVAAENDKRAAEARIFADCFATSAGEKCLALLRAKTIDRPPTPDELGERDPHAFALAMARRMGAANLVFQIESALDFARGMTKEDQNG